MNYFLASLGGFIVAVLLAWIFAVDQQLKVNFAVGQAQGKVDILQEYCPLMLEKSGLVKKKDKE